MANPLYISKYIFVAAGWLAKIKSMDPNSLLAVGTITVLVLLANALYKDRKENPLVATADQKENHAREFTTIETEVLTLWNRLQDDGQGALARDLLDAGLMHEHFNSLLDSDPAQRTPDELATVARLQSTKESLFATARRVLGGVVDSHS